MRHLRGVFGRNDVYANITGWDSFEPWLSRIESFPESSLWQLLDQIPPEWYGSAVDELERLLTTLLERRSRSTRLDSLVQELIAKSFSQLVSGDGWHYGLNPGRSTRLAM